jgi:hypothetical protein
MTHTPGPWTVRSEPGAQSGDGNEDEGWWYTLLAKADQDTFAEHTANARLMSAAPELVDVVKGLLEWAKSPSGRPRPELRNVGMGELLKKAQAAIAKAEGK